MHAKTLQPKRYMLTRTIAFACFQATDWCLVRNEGMDPKESTRYRKTGKGSFPHSLRVAPVSQRLAAGRSRHLQPGLGTSPREPQRSPRPAPRDVRGPRPVQKEQILMKHRHVRCAFGAIRPVGRLGLGMATVSNVVSVVGEGHTCLQSPSERA